MGSEYCTNVPGGRVCVLVRPLQSEPAFVQRFPGSTGRLAERAVVDEALAVLGFPAAEFPVGRRESGAPFFVAEGAPALSVSHTRLADGHIAAAVYVGAPGVGIDIEVPGPRIARVAPRVFHAEEQRACGGDALRLCAVWCTKEATWKARGPAVSFAEDLRVASAGFDALSSGGDVLVPGWFRGEEVQWWIACRPAWCCAVGPFTSPAPAAEA